MNLLRALAHIARFVETCAAGCGTRVDPGQVMCGPCASK